MTEPSERPKWRRPKDPRWWIRRALYKLYELTHPDEPWIAQGAVRFCDQALNRSGVGLEWGSGRSTAWYSKRLARLVSVEYQQSWYEKVSEKLRREGATNVDLRYVPLDHPLKAPTYPSYDVTPRYVAVARELFGPASLDFAVVDGHYRQACIAAVLPLLKSGGLLLVDNTDWMPLPEWGVPSEWPVAHQSSNVMGTTTLWRKP